MCLYAYSVVLSLSQFDMCLYPGKFLMLNNLTCKFLLLYCLNVNVMYYDMSYVLHSRVSVFFFFRNTMHMLMKAQLLLV